MKKIIFPKVNHSPFSIAVTAPSSGLGHPAYMDRINIVRQQLEADGHVVIFGRCLMENKKHVSAPRLERVKELLEFWNDRSIDLIHPPWGGENLIGILPLIDFESLCEQPTWIQGFSDTSTLLFAITVLTGIATAHGTNFIDMIANQDHLTGDSYKYLDIGLGKSFEQSSSEKWQKTWANYIDNPAATYNLTEPTQWDHNRKGNLQVTGRIIGGCLDTVQCLVGTPYGDIPEFSKNYAKEDGLLFYLENCEGKPTDVYRGLWNMRMAGWFDAANAVVFGRNAAVDAKNDDDMSYIEAIHEALIDLDIPIVWGADIGHVVPQMMVINGAMGDLRVGGGKARLKQTFC